MPCGLGPSGCVALAQRTLGTPRAARLADATELELPAQSPERLFALPLRNQAQTILHAQTLLPEAARAAVRECATGVEFWAQHRSLDAPMHLHWDCDEKLGRMTGLLVCPLLSLIVYVGDEGGPTLLIARSPADEGPSASTPAERCWLVWPHAGQIASFAGSMLHGVLRQEGATPASPAPAPPPAPIRGELAPAPMRTTVLLNFWARRPMDLPMLPRSVAPRLAAARPERPEQTPRSAAEARPVIEPGRVRGSGWAEEASRMWPSVELPLGMFDRAERWALPLPPVVYRQAQIEAFASDLRFAS